MECYYTISCQYSNALTVKQITNCQGNNFLQVASTAWIKTFNIGLMSPIRCCCFKLIYPSLICPVFRMKLYMNLSDDVTRVQHSSYEDSRQPHEPHEPQHIFKLNSLNLLDLSGQQIPATPGAG